jgi:MGT family glycosyltransferase
MLGALTLVVGMPETDPIPMPANIEYVGPILWEPPDIEIPDWIPQGGSDKPVISVYPGNPRYVPFRRSPFDSYVVLDSCIQALSDEPYQIVLMMGHQKLPIHQEWIPSNFVVASYLPGIQMAERSDLLVHHGGYGSCQTGLYAGVPAVIIPTYSERESNARRVSATGAAEVVYPRTDHSGRKRVDASELRDRIRHVLAKPSYLERAGKMQDKLRSHGGAKKAAALIEKVAA